MDGGAAPHCGVDTNGLVWLTANKDRQEKSRQPRRAKSDKPPRLARAGKVGDVGCSPGLMRNEEVVTAWASWYVIGTSWCV